MWSVLRPGCVNGRMRWLVILGRVRSPLAWWLSHETGHVYGVDEGRYGRASQEFCFWRPLARWAQAFAAWMDTGWVMTYALTGAEAFWMLARVEAVVQGIVLQMGRNCR